MSTNYYQQLQSNSHSRITSVCIPCFSINVVPWIVTVDNVLCAILEPSTVTMP